MKAIKHAYDGSLILSEAQHNYLLIESLKAKLSELQAKPVEPFDLDKENVRLNDLEFSMAATCLLYDIADEDIYHYNTAYIVKWLRIRIKFYEDTIKWCDKECAKSWQKELDEYVRFYNFLTRFDK